MFCDLIPSPVITKVILTIMLLHMLVHCMICHHAEYNQPCSHKTAEMPVAVAAYCVICLT